MLTLQKPSNLFAGLFDVYLLKVAIHQPNYFPWLGYFIKMHLADVFVFHDFVPLSDRSYTKRCKIKAPEGSKVNEKWLSLTLDTSNEKMISRIPFKALKNTLDEHLRHIQASYYSAPFFKEVFSGLSAQMDDWKQSENLATLNIKIISYIANKLDIYRECSRSSHFKIEATKDLHNLTLVKEFNGSSYLSGMGAKSYQQEEIYSASNIKLIYVESLQYLEKHPLSSRFNPTHSVLDALFNLGWSNVETIIKESQFLIE